jgi:hypothetical protein
MLAFLISRKERKNETTVKGGRASVLQGLSIGLYFTLGTGLVFLLLGFLVGYLEIFVTLSPAFFAIAGVVLILLGLNSAFSIFERIGALFWKGSGSGGGTGTPGWARAVRKAWGRSPEAGALLLGILFSLAWSAALLLWIGARRAYNTDCDGHRDIAFKTVREILESRQGCHVDLRAGHRGDGCALHIEGIRHLPLVKPPKKVIMGQTSRFESLSMLDAIRVYGRIKSDRAVPFEAGRPRKSPRAMSESAR